MKKLLVKTTVVIGFLSLLGCGEPAPEKDTVVIQGKYTGKNLLVQNPNNPEGIGFCVREVVVNGKTTSDEVNSASFEIDLKGLGLTEGDEVKAVLKCSEGCTPKILNPEVLD